VEAERIRIAGYPHDGVVQDLAATALALSTTASRLRNDGLTGSEGELEELLDTTRGVLIRVAAATGFTSLQSFALRSVVGVAAVALVQRFILYPSAALGFDLAVSVAILGIMLLLAYFMLNPRSR
jgi:hypothetical protein